jgi:hypothetical protein
MRSSPLRSLAVFIALTTVLSVSAAKDESQAGDFVKQHLNSIGTDQARAAVKNRLAQGTVKFQVLNRGPQIWDGPANFVSEGDKFASQLKFPPTVFRTELFVRNDQKTSVAQVRPGVWSQFGQFIMTHNEILTEGLWGGTLSTGWALSHLNERRAKLQDRGVKKMDGLDLHRIDYTPKKNSDLEIQLYFEPDTCRHVMTVYLMSVSAHLGRTQADSKNEQETHYRLEERFGDFKGIDDLTLPSRWIIRFTYGPLSEGIIDQYDITEQKVSDNISVDPKNFEVK